MRNVGEKKMRLSFESNGANNIVKPYQEIEYDE